MRSARTSTGGPEIGSTGAHRWTPGVVLAVGVRWTPRQTVIGAHDADSLEHDDHSGFANSHDGQGRGRA